MKNLILAFSVTLISTSTFAMKVTYDTVAKTCDWTCVDGHKGGSKDVGAYRCANDAKNGCKDHGGLVRFSYTGISSILDPGEVANAQLQNDEIIPEPDLDRPSDQDLISSEEPKIVE
jgi:hypothetical protein